MKGLLTERLALVGSIDPDACATGAQTSDWIDMSKFRQVMFAVAVGTLGSSATVDFKVQEATSSGGAGAADISGKSITQLTEAGTDSDKQVLVNVRFDELSDGFTHIAGVMTVGVATSDAVVLVFAGDPTYAPASDFDLASVDEIV